MPEFKYQCPSCGHSFNLEAIHFGGMNDLYVLRCDSCNKVGYVGMYGPEISELQNIYGLGDKLLDNISPALEKCECGGSFGNIPPRCPECKAIVTKQEIEKQAGEVVPKFIVISGSTMTRWKRSCGFCGSEVSNLTLVDKERALYVCDQCQAK